MRTETRWQVGPDSRVIVQPRDDFDPARLFIADARTSLTLVVPSDPTQYPEFVQFLSDFADTAQELASECEVP